MKNIDFNDAILKDSSSKDTPMQECLISTFLGIITIIDKHFLVVVDGISQIIQLENHEIYQISGVNFFCFDDVPLKKEIANYISNFKKVKFMKKKKI